MHPQGHPNPDRSPEALEARLRALPQPPVPADLEARLLAAIPAGRVRGRWAVWVGVVGAVAAACLLAVLAWPGRTGKVPAPHPEPGEAAHKAPSQPAEEPVSIAAWRESRRVLDGADIPPFTWPLENTLSA